MLLKAKTVFLLHTGNEKKPVYPGEVVEADEKTAEALLRSGACTSVPAELSIKSDSIPASIDAVDNKKDAEKASDARIDGESTDKIDISAWPFSDLKKLAQDMGVYDGKMKSRAAVLEAIKTASDELPEIVPQDVVDE